jgi:uroporphyrinogen decarboxylase
MNSRQRMLAACRNESVDRPPVWLMRQAGRYLPEYRQVREKHTFWQMVRTPELAAEVSLQPIRRFGMDAAILFSDILVVQDAMGLTVEYEKGGITIRPLIRSEADLAHLKPVDPASAFDYMGLAIERLCKELHPDVAVLGFAGAPFTLAAYLVEGGPSKNVNQLKAMAYCQPDLYDGIMSRVTEVVAGLVRFQIEAGADMVQLFDTWAWHLNPEDYERYALPYTRQVFEAVSDLSAPLTLYLRNAAGHLEAAAKSGCNMLSVDTSIRLGEARSRLSDSIALQGNFDPAGLNSPPDQIRARVQAACDAMGGQGYVVNVGQGLTPDTPVEGVAAFVKAVQDWGS